MNFWPLIQINSTYLTDSGMVGGTRYIANVEGLDALALDDSVMVDKALSGLPKFQTTELLLGLPITIRFPMILSSTHTAMVAIIQAYHTSSTAITLTVSGAAYPSVTSLSIVPDVPSVQFKGEYQNDRMLDVSYHFLTT